MRGEMGRRHAVLGVLLGAMALPVGAEEPRPGATDFTRTDPSAIQAGDIEEALGESRQTRLEPTVRPRALLPIYFEFDSAELRRDSRELLERVATALQGANLAGATIRVEGHTDAVGPADYNRELSERRAQTVARFLEAQGVSPGRLRTAGRGEEEPVASNDDEAGRARNRRVELVNLGS